MVSLANEITIKRVPNRSRLSFLPNLFGRHAYLTGESAAFCFARNFSEAYANAGGGYWEYFTTSNGSGFMVPVMDAPVVHVVNNGNYFEGDMSQQSFGIVCTVMALTATWERRPSDELVRKIDRLKDFAACTPEHNAIFAALD